jgi:uncharacterized protein YgiM (DUF1202 family)
MRLCKLFYTLLFVVSATVPAQATSREKFVDSCAKLSKELKGAKGSGKKLTIGRSILGGIVGATAGALLASKEDRGTAILAGAALGATAGAASAYIERKRREHADRRALAGSIYEDIAANNADAARALRAFSEVRRCRADSAARIKADVTANKLSAESGRDFLARHKELLEKDIAQAEKYTSDFDQAMEQFRGAAGFLAEGNANDQAYLTQRSGNLPPPPVAPPPIATAKAMVNMRGAPSTKGAILGKLAKGEAVELVGGPAAGWQQVRTGDGQVGHVLATNLTAPKKEATPAAPKINLAAVTPEVRTVTQPLYEGVEKRREMDAELQLARASTANETFTLAS